MRICLALALILALLPAPAAGAQEGSSCPQYQAPTEMVVSGGTPQTTKVGTPFSTPFSVELTDVDQCPVNQDQTGVPVTFSAPATGASGTFATTGTDTATVGTDVTGSAVAPQFTANDVAGTYTVTATSTLGSVTFSLTNTTTGVAASIAVTGGTPQTTAVASSFGDALTARVTDAGGDPVAGAAVTFAVVANDGAGADFAGGSPSATVQTDNSGTATAPTLTANSTAGSYTVTASTGGVATLATFDLTNLAAAPYAMTAGVGASESAATGSVFAIPLAVTVTDEDDNPVAGLSVTFHAPVGGAGGSFLGSGTTAVATTDAQGIAVAPAFIANETVGGYVVTATGAGLSAAFALVNAAAPLVVQPDVVAAAPTPDGGGFWMATASGAVDAVGDAGSFGSLAGQPLAAPVVGLASTPDGKGYWLVASDGGVFAFGDAGYHGSTGALRLVKPIVGMAATPDGRGYWLVASDGGVFAFGDAAFDGSTGAIRLAQPIVGMAATPDGRGYWLVASDGGVFAFGDAGYHGSTGELRLVKPIVGMAATPDGGGYWLVASDGGVFAFGDAVFDGAGGPGTVAIAPGTGGYSLVSETGGLESF
jgi:protocatechuate 3,4-dioxygenase beta subunit